MVPEFVAVASQPIPYLCQRNRSTSPLAGNINKRYLVRDQRRIRHFSQVHASLLMQCRAKDL